MWQDRQQGRHVQITKKNASSQYTLRRCASRSMEAKRRSVQDVQGTQAVHDSRASDEQRTKTQCHLEHRRPPLKKSIRPGSTSEVDGQRQDRKRTMGRCVHACVGHANAQSALGWRFEPSRLTKLHEKAPGDPKTEQNHFTWHGKSCQSH